MSHSSLGKKLKPAKKAWKRFTRTLESKVHSLNLSKAIKIIKNKSNTLLSYCSLHFFNIFKKHSITRPPSPYNNKNRHLYYSNKNKIYRNLFSPIYIDQLYSVEAAEHFHAHAETSRSSSRRGKEVMMVDEKINLPRNEEKAKEKVLYSIEDAWREVVAKSPQLRPVDERAEEFISKFHQEMKLQKEKSVLEFEEMLARGA